MPADAPVQGTLYHLPATPACGDAILPLRQMRTRYPDLYQRHARKYASRPAALDQWVEPLGCAWGRRGLLVASASGTAVRSAAPAHGQRTAHAGAVDPGRGAP